MVDINLFQEDDAEEEKNDSGQDEIPEDDLSDLLGDEFNDEFGGPADDTPETGDGSDGFGLDDEDFLDSDTDLDEVIPDIDEAADSGDSGDYTGGVKGRSKGGKGGPSVVLWVVFGIVLAAAAYYFLIFVPKQERIMEQQAKAISKRPDVQKLIEQKRRELAAQKAGQDSGAVQKPADTGASRVQQTKTAVTPARGQKPGPGQTTPSTVYAEMAGSIAQTLMQGKNLGSLLIFEDGFAVEYSAASPGTGERLSKAVSAAAGVSDLKRSPEESHGTGSARRYHGVISGKLPGKVAESGASIAGNYTPQQVAGIIKNLSASRNVSVGNIQVFSGKQYNRIKRTEIRAKLDGNGDSVLSLLEDVCGKQGNFRVLKTMIAPVTMNDYQGKKLKMVIDLEVIEGNGSR